MACNYEKLCDHDSDSELLTSGAARSEYVRADSIINPYQLEKLKFLACSLLSRRQVQDAEVVTNIYEELKVKFEQDARLAVSVLNTMLKIAGLPDENRVCADPRHHVLQVVAFQWRFKLIQYSDAAVECNKVSKLLDRMYKKYDIMLSREQVTSPITLFCQNIRTFLVTASRTSHTQLIIQTPLS